MNENSHEIIIASSRKEVGLLKPHQYLVAMPNLLRIAEMTTSLKAMAGVAHAKKIEIRCTQEEEEILRILDLGEGVEIIFDTSEQGLASSNKVEVTCMDRRLHHEKSVGSVSKLPKVTFAASALFLLPEIASKLETAGLGHLADDLGKIFSDIQESGGSVATISNHHEIKSADGSGGCGGLGVVKNQCNFVAIETAADYLAAMQEVRDFINQKFDGVAKGAKLVSYPTQDGVAVGVLDLENSTDFEVLNNSEGVVF